MLFLVPVLLIGGLATAQTSRFGEIGASVPTATVELGDTVVGELSANDPETNDGSYIDWYSIRLPEGEGARVDLESNEFDTYLVVRFPDGSEQTNDDFSGTDSGLTITGTGGELFIGATSFGFSATGTYTVSVQGAELADIAPGQAISAGQIASGVLDEPTVIYQLDGEPGAFVEVVLRSGNFDTYLEIEDSEGNYYYNDDAGNTSTSRLFYTVPADGTARIIVSSWSDSSSPSYSFTLEVISAEVVEEEYLPGYELSDGEVLSTELVRVPGQSDYVEKLYTVEASQGERIELELRSDEFDSYLTVYGPSGQTFEDDDSAGNLDSLLSIVVPEDGVYEVFVSSLGGDSTGAYTLSFERLGQAEIILDQPGELTNDDERDIDGKYYDVIEFSVSEGDRISIDLMSDDFDAYLTLWVDGEHVTRDDDGGSGSNSRILYTAGQSGRATIYVSTFSAEDLGAYQVSVYR